MRDQEDEPAEPVRLERIPGVPMHVPLGVLVAVALIFAAILKPWGTAPPPQPTVNVAVAPSPSVSPVPSDGATPRATGAPVPAVGTLCNAPPAWHLMTMETSELGQSRTMYSVEPVIASGPSDPSIQTADIAALRLDGIGACGPSARALADVAQPTQADGVRIWAFSAQGQPALESTVIVDARLFSAGEAYYGPVGLEPEVGGQLTPAWAPGRYVIEVDDATPEGSALWFGLDFSA